MTLSDKTLILNLIDQINRPKASSPRNSFLLREEAMNRLVQIGSEAVPHLIHLLKQGEIATREHAARALGYIGDPSAQQVLLDGVEDVYIRGACIGALEGMGASAVPALIDLSISNEDSVNSPARAVLSMLGEIAVPILREMLRDEGAGPLKREAAGYALSIIRKDMKCPFGGNRTMGVDCKFCRRKHKK